MNDATLPQTAATAGAGGPSPGRMLHEAREAQRIPIEALAAAIKVTPHKLHLLESDRFAELPDPAFTRALAQTVARYLKIDPAPVLALLPTATSGSRIEHLSQGLNTPYREHAGDGGVDWARVLSPGVLGPAVLLVIAGWIWLAPPDTLNPARWFSPSGERAAAVAGGTSGQPNVVSEVLSTPALTPAAPAAPVPAAPTAPLAAAPLLPPAPSVVTVPPAAAAAPAAPVTSDALLQVRALNDSWIEVIDADGRSLLSRTVRAGEVVPLDGASPLRVKICNAAGTELRFRGEVVDLEPATRDNIARLRLK